MKMKLSAIAMLLMASLAYGQNAAPNTAAAKASPGSKKSAATKSANKTATTKAATTKPATAKAITAKPTAKTTTAKATKPAAPPAKAKPAHSPMAAKPAKAVHHAAPKPAPAKVSTTAPAATPAASEVSAVNRKRDPFVNPVQAVREGRGDACSGGKRCLAANEIVLRGIVKAQQGMIAVVESSAQRTYFLRENDAIYNGFVQKITPDTVTFREHYTDNLGRDAQRDIVKTVNAPVV